jgi:glycosyltransferase involved in cell wall biosynthesis
MRIALAITTYERPEALAAVLATVAAQTLIPDEIVVADDGSGAATREVVQRASDSLGGRVRHVWQEHRGFRLTRLRNLAIANTTADYLIFVDGDMLLHPHFVADHAYLARLGHYTQGVRVPLDTRATAAALTAPRAARLTLRVDMRGSGMRRLYTLHMPRIALRVHHLANLFIAIKGCNQAFWRADLVRANGFNEAIEGWGPEDKELCARLEFGGARRQTLLFGGIAWHLAHPPAERSRQADNLAIYAATLRQRLQRCERGLDTHTAATGAPTVR